MTLNFYRMLQLLLLFGSVTFVLSQPVSCIDDSHCQEGYYCDSAINTCHKCIECEEYNRVTMMKSISCSKSITNCGTCVSGYLEQRGSCIPYKNESLDHTSNYKTLYWVIGVILILVIVVVIAVVVVRKRCSFKLFNFSHITSVECKHNGAQNVNQPDEPPPSYSLYPVPSVPTAPTATDDFDTGSSLPLLNGKEPSSQSARRRETIGVQPSAGVNNPPFYIRNSEIGINDNVRPVEDNNNIPPTTYEEEDTRESNWTPMDNTNANNNNNNAVALAAVPESDAPTLSLQLAAARGAELIRVGCPAPRTQFALLDTVSPSQESDNNGNQEEPRQSGTGNHNNISVNQYFNFNIQ